jgi:hypothetical protein
VLGQPLRPQVKRELLEKYDKSSGADRRRSWKEAQVGVRQNGKLFSSALVVAPLLVTATSCRRPRFNKVRAADQASYGEKYEETNYVDHTHDLCASL